MDCIAAWLRRACRAHAWQGQNIWALQMPTVSPDAFHVHALTLRAALRAVNASAVWPWQRACCCDRARAQPAASQRAAAGTPRGCTSRSPLLPAHRPHRRDPPHRVRPPCPLGTLPCGGPAARTLVRPCPSPLQCPHAQRRACARTPRSPPSARSLPLARGAAVTRQAAQALQDMQRCINTWWCLHDEGIGVAHFPRIRPSKLAADVALKKFGISRCPILLFHACQCSLEKQLSCSIYNVRGSLRRLQRRTPCRGLPQVFDAALAHETAFVLALREARHKRFLNMSPSQRTRAPGLRQRCGCGLQLRVQPVQQLGQRCVAPVQRLQPRPERSVGLACLPTACSLRNSARPPDLRANAWAARPVGGTVFFVTQAAIFASLEPCM